MLVESVDGFAAAVGDVFPLSINAEAFSYIGNAEIDKYLYVGQEIQVLLPGETNAAILQVNNLEQNIDETLFTYSGTIKDANHSSFVITLHEDVMDGQIVVEQQLHTINHISTELGPVQTLTWIDRRLIDSSHFSDDAYIVEGRDTDVEKTQNNNGKSGSNGGVVRVLFMYGSDVSNPTSLTSQIVGKINTVFNNSGIYNYTVSVADIDIMNTDFGIKCRVEIRDDMDNRNPPFSDIDTKVTNTYADMVVVIAKGDVPFACGGFTGRVGGIANVYDQYGGNSNNRFATFSDNYALGDLTAIHEMGHVFGGLHDVLFNGVTAWANNQAIVSTDVTEQTVVGGVGHSFPCDFEPPINGVPQQDCIRKEYFSHTTTKTQFTDLSPVGTSTRNNAEYFNNTTLADIAGFRPDPPAPNTAPVLTNLNHNCFGMNELSWNVVNLANSYQVYRDDQINFQNPVRVYNGMNQSLFTNHGSTVYYRVKACNEGGCSGYSNVVTATYINGCQ